jgi:hypothetical protein
MYQRIINGIISPVSDCWCSIPSLLSGIHAQHQSTTQVPSPYTLCGGEKLTVELTDAVTVCLVCIRMTADVDVRSSLLNHRYSLAELRHIRPARSSAFRVFVPG